MADHGPRKFPAHLNADAIGDMLGKKLGAGVFQRQQNDVLPRQDNLLFSVPYFYFVRTRAHLDCRACRLNQCPMVQAVANALDQRLERYEVEYHTSRVELAFHAHRNLVVVAVQRFSLAVGKNQEMRRSKIEIIFCNFNAE
jgi:hypothetical protein